MIASIDQESPTIDPRVAKSRAKMLAAATELFVDDGPRAVTVDAVVERSGVAKSTLYRHWESSTALLVDVVSANIPDMVTPDLSGGFEHSLRALVHQFADALSDPKWGRIMPAMLALKHQIPEIAELTTADHQHQLVVLETVLDQGVAEGGLPPGLDPQNVASTLIGPLVFSCVTDFADKLPELADYVADRFIASYAHNPPEGPDPEHC